MTNIKSKAHQILSSLIVTIGIFGLGTVLGWSSTALPNMTHEKHGHFLNISNEEQSWISSAATLGALGSCPVSGFSIEKLGRKRTMLIASIPFAIGWILIGFSSNIFMLCIGRFISGFCGGIFSLTSPIYIGETAESHIRGMLMNTFQIMLVTGILFTYIVGTFVSWKALALISSLIPIMFLVLSLLIPETPRYLITKGKYFEAQKALCWLRGSEHTTPIIDEELSTVRKSVEDSQNHTLSFRDILKPNVMKPLAISLSLMIWEQASAFNVVIFYCVDIFAAAGTSLNSYVASIIVAVVQVVATVLGTFLVDKAGRRILLIFSELVMTISFIALGAFFFTKELNGGKPIMHLGWLPLVSITLFIVAFSVGIGPLSWTIMGEILHPNVKGFCSAIAVSLVWFLAFVVTKIYASLVDAVGIHWSFWIFSGVSALGTISVYFTVPETKGKTLDEIQLLFVKPTLTKVNKDARDE